MVSDLHRFLNGLSHRPAASGAALAESEKQSGAKFPEEYTEFLKLTNGGEGFVGKEYVILWSVEELGSMNRAYEVQKYAAGLMIFGSNGGGEAYGFDTRTSQWLIVRVPFVGMDWASAKPMGSTFSAFLAHLCEAE